MSTTTFNWSTPLTLSSSSLNSSDAVTAIDSKSNVDAVWVENGIIKSSSKSVSTDWTTAVNLSNSGATLPRLVMDINGNSTVLWIENGLVKTSSKSVNGTWSTAAALSSSGASSPTIAVDTAGNIVTAWIRGGTIESSTKLYGASWQNKVIITTNLPLSAHIAIGGSGSSTRAMIVWHSTATNLIYATTKLLSGNWSTQQAISNSLSTSMCAKVAIDANANPLVIWYAYTLTGNIYSNVIVQSAYRFNSTGLWSEITDLSTAGICDPTNLSPNIKFDSNGNAIAVWNISFDGSNFSIQSATKPVREKWGSVSSKGVSVMNVANSLYSFTPDINIMANGNGLCAFPFYNGASLLILTSEMNLSGRIDPNWSVPSNVSQETNNGFPHVATAMVGDNINAAIIWSQFDGLHNVIKISIGLRLCVDDPANLSVVQNNNNFGIFTEYYNKLQWTASEDSDVVGYAIFRNGKFINQTSQTNYIDNNQAQNRSVTYGVAAINNQQSQSNIITVVL